MADPPELPSPLSSTNPSLPPSHREHYSQERLLRQIREAEEQAEQVAFVEHRDRVRMDLGAPQAPSRGRGDCLALVLLPLGLVLLVVHPLPAAIVLAVVGWLYLAGSDRLSSEREAIRAADHEAARRWRSRRGEPPDSDAP